MTSRGNAIAIAMIAAEIVAHLSWPGSEYLQRTSPGRATSLKRLKVPPGHFCGDCGSPIGFEADHYTGGMHLYAASLEDPSDFSPTFHVNFGSKLDWLGLKDGHEKYESTLAHSDKDLSAYK